MSALDDREYDPEPASVGCERCGLSFVVDSRRIKRFCSRRCRENAYHAMRRATDPAFHARALEYQRLWRVRESARRRTARELLR